MGQFWAKYEILHFFGIFDQNFYSTLFLPIFSKIVMGLKSNILVLYFPINNIKKRKNRKKGPGSQKQSNF
jgi:hypothetical protein